MTHRPGRMGHRSLHPNLALSYAACTRTSPHDMRSHPHLARWRTLAPVPPPGMQACTRAYPGDTCLHPNLTL